MKGSYSVPIGSNRSPLIECDRPSADSRMNRFISAMPSSMCWPLGENSQLKVDGMCSLLKMSAIASCANRPRRLTQAPRLVETVTSGEVVTMRRANSLSARPISLRMAPKPVCVEVVAWNGAGSSAGTSSSGPFRRRALADANGTESRNFCKRCRRQRQAFELVPFVAGAHRHRLAEHLHLRRRHQAGVIVLVAGERQAEAFDGVADEAGRPVVVGVVERLEH